MGIKKRKLYSRRLLFRIGILFSHLPDITAILNFHVEGEAPADKELHYTKALNVVRIVQEAVTNAIKHASPKTLVYQQ